MDGYNPIVIESDGSIFLLDQRFLPDKKEYFSVRGVDDVCTAIKDMVIRGAPLIGIIAAFGVYIGIRDSKSKEELFKKALFSIDCLSKTRPTAVNLFYALDRMKRVLDGNEIDTLPLNEFKDRIRTIAYAIWEEQKRKDRIIGELGAEFLKGKRKILTHCNTGTLATGGIGTALGIIKTMFKYSGLDLVYVDETRPYLQGSRLTAFELERESIPYKIVTDNSCGMLFRKGLVDAVVVGADRIAKNGDVANKIGTYCLANVAKRYKVTFLVAAPESTIDRTIHSLDEIPVEERSKDEVLRFAGVRVSPKNADAINFSFDLTESNLIDAIITERGVYRYPYRF